PPLLQRTQWREWVCKQLFAGETENHCTFRPSCEDGALLRSCCPIWFFYAREPVTRDSYLSITPQFAYGRPFIWSQWPDEEVMGSSGTRIYSISFVQLLATSQECCSVSANVLQTCGTLRFGIGGAANRR